MEERRQIERRQTDKLHKKDLIMDKIVFIAVFIWALIGIIVLAQQIYTNF